VFRLIQPRRIEVGRRCADEALEPFSVDGRWDYFKHVLHLLLSWPDSVVHCFYHEEYDYVRVCLWQPGGDAGLWEEYVPMTGAAGLPLLREIRARLTRRRKKRGWLYGELPCRWQGRKPNIAVESPHNWDVRLFTGSSRPKILPYTLLSVCDTGNQVKANGMDSCAKPG
jgi:hypothetical protein